MRASVVLSTFGIMFLAELPDKTFLATMYLSGRYRATAVALGSAGALGVHVALALAAGRLLLLVPHRALEAIVALAFAGGAAYLLLVSETHETVEASKEESEADAALSVPAASPDPQERNGVVRVAAVTFGVVFLGEFGDLTQILTVNLSARFHSIAAVGVGAVAGMWAAVAVAVTAGRAVAAVVPMRVVRTVSGVILLAMAVWSAVSAVHG